MTQMLGLRTCRLSLAATAISMFASWSTGPAVAFSVQLVTDPTGNNQIELLGINNGGTIVGFDNGNPLQGFTMTLPNNFTPQNFPGATSTAVTGINNNGNTAGYYIDTSGNTNGFTKTGAAFTTVNAPGTAFNRALGINDSNTTVGYSAVDQAGITGQVAYKQSGGAFTTINSLLPANVNAQATGINNANNIVGFYQPMAGGSRIGFLDVAGTITTIDPFSSTFTEALGINNNGEIVGFYTDSGGFQHGYVDNGGVFTTFDPTGSVSTTISGVNDLGQIVGFYSANEASIGFVGTPDTPIPAALPLFATGLGGLGLLGWRRQRKTLATG
jgi:hypothetical protein